MTMSANGSKAKNTGAASPAARSLSDLVAEGAFVDPTPVPVPITYTLDDGVEREALIHVKRLSIGDYQSLVTTGDAGRSHVAEVVEAAIRLGAGGKEQIGYKDAYRLHVNLANAMMNAFHEVNSPKKT